MELAPAGYFSKTHGIKGHLILKEETPFFIEQVKTIFIEIAGGKAPYFIQELKDSNNGLIVLLEEVDTIEKAKLLLGKKVFVDASLLEAEEEDFNWLGFEIIDKKLGSLGQINGVSDNGQQLLVTVVYNGKEVILPLVDEFIGQIDVASKKLFFNAPEGLIDVYLNESE